MCRLVVSFLLSTFLITSTFASTQDSDIFGLNPERIETLTKAYGFLDTQKQIFKVVSPRDDLKVSVNGVKLTAGMGLTSWALFKHVGDFTIVKGELALAENQIDAVLGVVIDNHLTVTALHNHFLWESPKIMFMHFEAIGHEENLAAAVGHVFAKIKETNNGVGIEFPIASITAKTTLDSNKVDAILGTRGHMENGVYKVVLGRSETITNDFNEITLDDIHATATFAGSNNNAVIDGDILMQAEDTQSVVSTIHHAGILLVAIHPHMTNNPRSRLVYLHYFGVGTINTLANGLRNAIDSAQPNAVQRKISHLEAMKQRLLQMNVAQLNNEVVRIAERHAAEVEAIRQSYAIVFGMGFNARDDATKNPDITHEDALIIQEAELKQAWLKAAKLWVKPLNMTEILATQLDVAPLIAAELDGVHLIVAQMDAIQTKAKQLYEARCAASRQRYIAHQNMLVKLKTARKHAERIANARVHLTTTGLKSLTFKTLGLNSLQKNLLNLDSLGLHTTNLKESRLKTFAIKILERHQQGVQILGWRIATLQSWERSLLGHLVNKSSDTSAVAIQSPPPETQSASNPYPLQKIS